VPTKNLPRNNVCPRYFAEHYLAALVFFLMFAGLSPLWAQAPVSGGEPRLIQQFSWNGDENTLRYEVVVEKEEDGVYRDVYRIFTTALSVALTLSPGNYRCCVIPYDFLDRPGGRSEWFNMEVRAPSDSKAPGEKKFAIGLGPEWNMNSRNYSAVGFSLGFDFNLSVAFAAGLTVTASSDFSGSDFSTIDFSSSDFFSSGFSDTIVIEPTALFRWYFLGKRHTGFFAQVDAGAYLIFENDDFIPFILGGLRGGCRLPLGSMFYAEPYVRFGYPFIFGIGAIAGLRF